MFTVNKKELQQTYSMITKLIGNKFSELYLDVTKDGIWIIINVESYIKVFVPAEVEEEGRLKIQQGVFQPIFALRGETLKCSFNREQNILNVSAGTKTSLYVSFKVNDDDIAEPEIDDKAETIKIKSSAVGDLKQNLNYVHFNSPDLNSHDYALMKNTPDSLSLTFATTNLCTNYTFNKSLSDEEFEITVPIERLKLALSMINTNLKLYITENYLYIKSVNLTVTLPALLDTQFLGFIESCDNLLGEDDAFEEGNLEFTITDVKKTLDSVRSISQGSNIVDFKTKNNSLIISLENKIGSTKDKCALKSTSMEDGMKFAIPELFIDSAFFMAGKIGSDAVMQFGSGFRFFYLRLQDTKGIDFFVLGPISQE